MLETGTNLCYADSIEGGDFERCARQEALIRVKTALSLLIISTTDHVVVTSKEDSVRIATAHLNDLVFKHIKCFGSYRQKALAKLRASQLPTFIASPRINFGLGKLIIIVFRSSIHILTAHDHDSTANHCRKVGSTRHLFNTVAPE